MLMTKCRYAVLGAEAYSGISPPPEYGNVWDIGIDIEYPVELVDEGAPLVPGRVY